MSIPEESSNGCSEELPEGLLEELAGLVDGLEEAYKKGGPIRITALGWVAIARIQSEDGHDVETCDCSLCLKARRFLGKIYYARCAFCQEHIEAPYIKNGDLLHCARCHRRRCSPVGAPCAGGPVKGGPADRV